MLGFVNVLFILLVEKISEVVLDGLKKVFYFDLGFIVVEIVIKMVF